MTTRSFLLTGMLILASFSMAYAKSYDFVFATKMKAGNVDLKPGEYNLTVKGGTAVFTSVDTGNTYTAPVKVENAPMKFDQTVVDSNDNNEIQKIDLGGSTTVLEFNE